MEQKYQSKSGHKIELIANTQLGVFVYGRVDKQLGNERTNVSKAFTFDMSWPAQYQSRFGDCPKRTQIQFQHRNIFFFL